MAGHTSGGDMRKRNDHDIEDTGDTSESDDKKDEDNGYVKISGEAGFMEGPADRKYKQWGCFIATAVYGDVNAPEVQILRDFRNNVLMENGLGRKVVDLYYSGVGERVADFIRTQVPSVIPLVRKGLDGLVQYYQAHK